MKKLSIGIIIGLVIGLSCSAFAEVVEFIVEKANFPILVNGKEFKTDKTIVTINGSTYMPLRVLGEALNVKVEWNSDLNRVEIGETPTETQFGYSNPAPLNTIQTIEYKDFMNEFKAEMSVKEIIRGDEAWQMIKSANQFNSASDDGFEYIVAKIYFKLNDIQDGKAYDLSNVSINLISSEGKEYDTVLIVSPSPAIDSKLYKGSSNEGWAVFAVKKEDTKPKIAFGRKYDGTGGVWFQAYK